MANDFDYGALQRIRNAVEAMATSTEPLPERLTGAFSDQVEILSHEIGFREKLPAAIRDRFSAVVEGAESVGHGDTEAAKNLIKQCVDLLVAYAEFAPVPED